MPRKTEPAAAPAPATEKAPKRLIPDDTYVNVEVIDADVKPTGNGEPRAVLQLEVLSPRGYAGRTLYFSVQPSLDKTMEALGKEFPGQVWTDAEALWKGLGHAQLRAHVFIEPERAVDGQTYQARNKVTGLWKPKARAAS